MIRKAVDMSKVYEKNLKNGQGTIEITNFLQKEESYDTGRLFAISVIPPGCSIGYHQHAGDFEIYYILKGSAKVVDNGTEAILEPGDGMVCRDGEWHSIENNSKENLEYVSLILYTNKADS